MKSKFVGMAFLLLAGASVVHADDSQGNVRFEYWPFSLNGDATVKGTSADLEDTNKVFNGSSNGFIFGGERKFDDWGMMLELFWGERSGRNQISDSKSADWNIQVAHFAFAGYLPLVETEYGEDEKSFGLDALAGLRSYVNSYKVEFDPFDSSTDKSGSDEVRWIDPYLGLRLKTDLSDAWSVELYGDAGGFGVGAASELSYLVRGTIVWATDSGFAINGGYRLFSVKSERQRGDLQTETDLQLTGPTIGVAYKF